eukprot:GABW01004888.1.p2 GENE.GABW01004888.1~~GABW01004888.1.p2  ORF type:complete len:52 (-),score=1.33 GABW01004888.1:3-158(-)
MGLLTALFYIGASLVTEATAVVIFLGLARSTASIYTVLLKNRFVGCVPHST